MTVTIVEQQSGVDMDVDDDMGVQLSDSEGMVIQIPWVCVSTLIKELKDVLRIHNNCERDE